MEEKGEIILYHPDEELKLEVRLEGETVWLNRQQLSILFDRDVKTIGKHVNNALKEELAGLATVAKFATVQNEGGRTVTRQVEYYNLDMILSVGYRVKSQRGIELRRWSNGVLKEYLLKGYAINQRIEHLENKMDSKFIVHDRQLKELASKVDFFVRTSLPPVEGVFFNGQIFDAYVFATNLIRSAKKSLLLIDNYIDESVLLMLAKRNSGASATIFTGRITAQLQLDLDKHNDQYPPINIRTYANAHDRFIIIDETEVYHIGASLKDLGKKLFAFTKMNMPASVIMNSLEL
ncbi:virulence RhuM family protein [Bacteroides fragilis]|uniref:virulence RhuM family protein n=1 Tax=Bacteroides fragilis TaxID=817 RepID=UPI0022AA2E17|nr:RhuM family protein [Bacteroides fragilis]MCE9046981.1 virulence RhuM family protein [Bacteroides fragilis]MCZ2660891.1 RhuM family protein [Bacteroides fragilis]